MDDDSVFADFANYSDVAYAEEYRTIYAYIRDGNQRYGDYFAA